MRRQLKESPQTGGRGFRDTFPPLDKVSTTGMPKDPEIQPRTSETPLKALILYVDVKFSLPSQIKALR